MKPVLDTTLTALECYPSEKSFAEAMQWARDNLAGAWILLETPQGIIWRPLQDLTTPPDEDTILNMIAFDEKSELRLEKRYGQKKGFCRILREKEGDDILARKSSYILADNKGRLLYAEYFDADKKTGAWKPFAGRFCGVEHNK